MRNLKVLTCGLVLFSSLIGCNNAVKSFIDASGPGRGPASQIPLEQIDGAGSIKISPGHVQATGTGISMKATITATNVSVTGTGISGRLSLHQQPSR